MLAPSLVASAARRILFTGGDVTDAHRLASETERALNETRALLTGEPVEVSVVTGLVGVALSESRELATPWGVLRGSTEQLSRVRPFDVGATAVVETSVQSLYSLGEPPESERWRPDTALQEKLTKLHMLLPLAILLGVQREDHYVVSEWVWQTTLHPALSAGPFSGIYPSSALLFRDSTVIEDDDRERVELWARQARQAGQHYHPSLSVAVRRTLSAVRERGDAEDALIDAVIAWESMFGPGAETEVTFRVTSAIALLLETHAKQRARRRTDLTKVYSSRSKVVHGGIVDRAKLEDHKELAISTAVDCLKALLSDQVDLIPHQDRGLHLILRVG
jgi:hypothetical protein